MPKYYVAATWRQNGFHIIEADSQEAAEEAALNGNAATLTGETLDTLPPPWQEEGNDDYEVCEVNDHNVRFATPEEVARAEGEDDVRHAARAVLAAWEGGDLAAAMRQLSEAMGVAA